MPSRGYSGSKVGSKVPIPKAPKPYHETADDGAAPPNVPSPFDSAMLDDDDDDDDEELDVS